jgi:hypothetical protein
MQKYRLIDAPAGFALRSHMHIKPGNDVTRSSQLYFYGTEACSKRQIVPHNRWAIQDPA